MTTNITKLRGKGAPPPAEVTPDVIATNARGSDEPNTTIQFSIPPSVYREFSQAAGKIDGGRKGAKTKLFLEMWQAYLGQKA